MDDAVREVFTRADAASKARASLLIGRLAAHLDVHQLRHSSERVLQAALEACLRHGSFVFWRERGVGKVGRPDFLIQGENTRVALEAKVGGTFAQLLEQVQRYALCDDVDGVLAVTTREVHDRLPDLIAGKPLRTVVLSAF